jgi:hypothetical protein
MDSNIIYSHNPAYVCIMRAYMDMLDDASTPTWRPPGDEHKAMWNMFLESIGVGYNVHHQLQVQDAQKYLVACLRYSIPH